MKQSDEWLYSTHLSLKDAGRQIVSSVEVVVPCELEGTLEVNATDRNFEALSEIDVVCSRLFVAVRIV